jgi:hypothetical protein
MATVLTVGRGGTVAETIAVFSWPPVKVHSRAIVGWVAGLATMSDSGKAVGFEDTRVNGTSGGAETDAGAEVTVAGGTLAESVAGAVVTAAESVA